MSTLRQIFSNTAVQVAGKLVTGLLGIVTIKLLTGYFDQETFGDYTVVFEFLAFFGIMADMGLFTIAVREMSRPGADEEKILGNILGIRLTLATLALSAAVATAIFLPNYGTEVERGVLVASLSMLAAFAAGSSSTILQKRMQMQWQALGLILGKITTITLIAAGVVYSQPFLYFLVAGLVGNLIYLASIVFFVSRLVRLRILCDWDYWLQIIKTALPYGLALILGTIYFRIDSVMLYQMQGRTATAMYGVAVKALEILAVVPVFFLNSTMPTLTRYIAEKSSKIQRLVQLAWDFLACSGLAIAGGVVVIATPIILFISRPEYAASATPLRILMVAMLASFLNSIFGYILVASNQQVKLLWINLVCVFINVGANLYAIPRWSYTGAAVTSIISEFFILVATATVALRILKIRLSVWPLLKMLVATVVMVATLLQLPHTRVIDLALVVPLGGLIYLGLLFGLRTFDKNILREVLRLRDK